MKLIQTKKASWVVAMALLATPGLLITSCSKDNQTEAIQPKANQITFSVKGINSGNTEDELKRASVSTTTAQQKIYSFSDVDMAVSVDNVLPNQTVNFGNIQRSGGLTAAGTSTPDNMAPNVKYVVYIYSGNTLVSSKLMENGVDATIDGLNPATTYTWVALSYNTTDTDQPSLAPTNGTVSLPANKDVLYASGTVKLSDNSNIAILFNHKFARIGIELNTIGIFGEIDESTIPTADVTGLTIAGGDINLLGDGGSVLPGTVTAGTATSHDLHFADFAKVDANYNDAKIAYVYTASTAPQSAINMKVQNLKIKHVDGNLARTYYSTAANFAFNVTPQQGKSHHLLLNVIESPLVTTLRNNVTVKWARSNLFDRNNGDGLRGYAFYANNIQRSRADGYFSYKGLRAAQFPSTTTSGDPCASVYPSGTWKLPSEQQISSMTTGSAGLLSSVLSTVGTILGGVDEASGSSVGTTGGNYAQYNTISGGTTGTNAFGTSTSNSNNLRFFYNGQITDLSVLAKISTDGSGLLGLGLSNLSVDLLGFQIVGTTIPVLGTTYNSTAALWSGTDIVPGTLGLNLGSYGYTANTTTASILGIPIGRDFVRAKTTAELLSNVGLGSLTLLNTSFKNVRCVRTN